MKVAAIQLDIVWERPDQNFARAGELIADAASDGARLIVLPEMYSSGFSMNTDWVAEPRDGLAHAFLLSTARQHGVYLAASRAERTELGPQNVAYLIGPSGNELLRYAKIHPFAPAGEALHYAAGSARPVATIDGLKVAIAICYDLRFPELFRAWCFDGVELFIVPANWPTLRVAHWSSLLVARAIENQAFVVGVNRTGDGGDLSYNGQSAIIDPLGKTLAQGEQEPIVAATIDPQQVARVRKALPFLGDARRDLFPCLHSPGQ